MIRVIGHLLCSSGKNSFGEGKATLIRLVFCPFLCRFGFYKYMKMDRPEKNLDSGEKTEQPGRGWP